MNSLLQPDAAWMRAARGARLSVLATAVALLAMIVYLGWREGYFTPVSHFHFQTNSSKSLSKGMAVRLSGFKIGQVSRVELQPDRSVRVDLAVLRPYLDFVKTDSTVRLDAEIPIGSPSLEIIGGSVKAPLAESGTELRYKDQVQLYDRLDAVVQHLEPMIDNVSALLAQARQPQGELQTSLRNLADMTAHVQAWVPGFLERTDAALASLNRVTGLASDSLSPLAKSDGDLQGSLREVRATVAELHNSLPPLLTDLKSLTTSLRASAATLETTMNRLAPQLPAAVDEGRRTAAGAGEVVNAIKDFGLIRGKIDHPKPEPVLPTTQP